MCQRGLFSVGGKKTMSEENWREGAIFRWSWNADHLNTDHSKLKSQAGTLYWCCSRIGVVVEGRMIDTFWGERSSSKIFYKDFVEEKMELSFIANKEDLIQTDPSERAYYLDKDCVDLNHPNSTSGNFYIRRGAKKNLEKMKRVVQRDIIRMKKEIEYELSLIRRNEEILQSLTVEDRIYIDRKYTSIEDENYYDE